MSAVLLDGKLLALRLKDKLTQEIADLKALHHQSPRIVSIVVGNDPATLSYIAGQERSAKALGINYELQQQPETISQQALIKLIKDLNVFDDIHGIMLNKPLPNGINFDTCIKAIDPAKDIERINLCTPAAAIELLRSSGVSLKGKHAVVIGRSEIVGRPVAMLLLDEHCTVTICHSATINLDFHLQQADIVVVAIGKPNFLKGAQIKSGAIVIDVGINQVDGNIVGDVDFISCQSKASFISPVPGGVGPVTSVILMQNALKAFKNSLCQIS